MTSIILFGLLGTFASAATPLSAKIDSFVYTSRQTTAAELCGHIEGTVKSPQQILIVSDPKSKAPGKYVALTTPKGEFCAVIATTTGEADVSIVGASSIPLNVSIATMAARETN